MPIILLFTMFPLLITFLCIYLLTIYWYQFRRDPKFSGTGPPTYPIIGCLISFYRNTHRLLDWYTDFLSTSHTQTIIIRRFGARRAIITANPENVEYILKTNFSNYPKGQPFTDILGDFLGCGIFNVDGELWHTQRKLASHEFTARSMRDFVVNTLEQVVERKLLPIMACLAKENDKVVDLQEILRRLSFDIVCKVSLGINVCSMDSCLADSSLARAFSLAAEISAKRASEPVPFLWKMKRLFGVGSERKLREAIDEIHKFVREIIHHKKKGILKNGENSHGDQDLLSKMMVAGHEEAVLRDMVISIILAGRDTTSAAMTWLFYLLSCHPNVEEEIVEELNFVEKERSSHYEALKKMRFLEACLCESMRLYPPVAWDSKHAISGDFLPDGTQVHAGDRVSYFPYGMGRMKNLWGEDRFEFKPERWFLEPDGEGRGMLGKVCPYKFPVFQAGPRVCLGKEMAFIQMKYIVASIIKRFEIRPVGLENPVFVPLLTAHMAGGFKVLVRQRQKPVKD